HSRLAVQHRLAAPTTPVLRIGPVSPAVPYKRFLVLQTGGHPPLSSAGGGPVHAPSRARTDGLAWRGTGAPAPPLRFHWVPCTVVRLVNSGSQRLAQHRRLAMNPRPPCSGSACRGTGG